MQVLLGHFRRRLILCKYRDSKAKKFLLTCHLEGYYVCFFNEFITMNFERDIVNILERSPMMKPFWEHPASPILSQVGV